MPESLKPFARCNAVRLTHERFRADMAGLVKSLEQVLSEAEAARKAEGDAVRRDAKAREKAEAERLRQEGREQSRKRREAKTDVRPRNETSSVVGWIAGLPSEISWHIPLALVAIALLGWFLPGRFFTLTDGLGWGLWSLLYGLAGLTLVAVICFVRRKMLGGAELALYWLALVFSIGLIVFSLYSAMLAQAVNYLPIAALSLVMAGSLVAVRRNEIGGLEFAVYWVGLTLFLYAAGIALVTNPSFRLTELGAFFEVPRRAPGILMLSAIGSGLAILAWRNRRLSRPELALYLIGIAYWLFMWIRLVQE